MYVTGSSSFFMTLWHYFNAFVFLLRSERSLDAFLQRSTADASSPSESFSPACATVNEMSFSSSKSASLLIGSLYSTFSEKAEKIRFASSVKARSTSISASTLSKRMKVVLSLTFTRTSSIVCFANKHDMAKIRYTPKAANCKENTHPQLTFA